MLMSEVWCSLILTPYHASRLQPYRTLSLPPPCHAFLPLGLYPCDSICLKHSVFLHFNYISTMHPSGFKQKSLLPRSFLNPPYLLWAPSKYSVVSCTIPITALNFLYRKITLSFLLLIHDLHYSVTGICITLYPHSQIEKYVLGTALLSE